jgi:hypothetical protein
MSTANPLGTAALLQTGHEDFQGPQTIPQQGYILAVPASVLVLLSSSITFVMNKMCMHLQQFCHSTFSQLSEPPSTNINWYEFAKFSYIKTGSSSAQRLGTAEINKENIFTL